MSVIKVLWAYRGFIFGSVRREFQSKYHNSLLGIGWSIINPLAMIVVYTVIFSKVMGARLPGVGNGFAYSIYLCSGTLTWGFFADIVGRAQNMFLDNANLLKKVSFPRMTLPVVVIFNAGVGFSIIFCLFLIFLLVVGAWPGWVSLAAFPVLAIELLLAIGLGMVLGVLNVFFRDVGLLFGVILQFWFWFTPVVYPASILPERVKPLMSLNPMYPLVTACHEIFVAGSWPDWISLLYPLILGLVFCGLGLHLFRKNAGEMVDEF